MDVLLFRHGIAADREEWNGEDAVRPLTDKGIVKTRESVAGLRRLGVEPTHVLSSPLVRAIETAKLVRSGLKVQSDLRICDELQPEAAPDKLLPLLSSLPPDSVVVCVGHEPNLGATAGLMLCGASVAGLSLKKAGCCAFSFSKTPKAGSGFLNWWMAPAQLRKLART